MGFVLRQLISPKGTGASENKRLFIRVSEEETKMPYSEISGTLEYYTTHVDRLWKCSVTSQWD